MVEAQYVSATSINRRKEFGQYFTPATVARLMLRWVLKDGAEEILDPAFGLGVFYREACRVAEIKRFIGYEIDSHILDFLPEFNLTPHLDVRNSDYLTAQTGKFDAIVCNPPYMRFQKFIQRYDVMPEYEKLIERKIAGYTNVASLFLMKALYELKRDGSLAFIMPSEFFNTGYGIEIKKRLMQDGKLKQIVLFFNEKEVFPEVTTTVAIVLCKNDGVFDDVKVSIFDNDNRIQDVNEFDKFYQRSVPRDRLSPDTKWTPILLSDEQDLCKPEGMTALSYYGAFKRGIATGANEFFSMTLTQLRNIGIARRFVKPCITKSSQIRSPIFTNDQYAKLVEDDKPVFCLDVVSAEDPGVRRYIESGERKGFHRRYLTRNRVPWFRIEKREPAPILFGVFHRGGYKVIRNYTEAINLTCFHSFYPNVFGDKNLDKLFVYLISKVGSSFIKKNTRRYGDNLDKIEPNDLNSVLCPSDGHFRNIDDDEARRIVRIAQIDAQKAYVLSDNAIEKALGIESACTENMESAIKEIH
jgi:adenine-specific DNA-methyltransferase